MRAIRRLFGLLLIAAVTMASPALTSGQNQETKSQDETLDENALWAAARKGDVDKVKAAIAAGVDVDAKTEYGATALFYACDRGHDEIVEFLLEKGADPNTKDTFYNATPVTWAQMNDKKSVIVKLLAKGGKGADGILFGAVTAGNADYVRQLLDIKVVEEAGLIKARDAIETIKDKDAKSKIQAMFAELNLPESKMVDVSPETLKRYVGKYENDRFGVEVTSDENGLLLSCGGGEPNRLTANSETSFALGANEITFELDNEAVSEMVANFGGNEFRLKPAKAAKTEEPKKEMADSKKESTKEAAGEAAAKKVETSKFTETRAETRKADLAISSSNWPGFRGNGSRGIADGQKPPVEWGEANVNWKVPVPGLGLSCPTIWQDRVYVTSAVAEGEEGGLKIGLYGDVASIQEDNEYEFKVFCFDKTDGKLIWEQTANKAVPAVKRHAKSSHANATVATDGKHVVAFFGSEGLYCYSADGELIWKRDFGFLDSGWFYDPGYQWGFGSSPIIFENKVIVQCDIQGQSFIAALNVETGDEIWRTERDEIPSWSTPLVHKFDDVSMLITNGTKSARGYNVEDGSLLWSLKEHSEIVVPTPNVAHGLIYIASGYSPIQPIYAIKPSARGDISLGSGSTTGEAIPWSVKRGGPYMPSPIIYGDYLYCCANSGILTCYRAETGEVVYKKRMKAKGGSLSFTASPLAADGHLYLTAEDGRVLVVKAGPEYKLVNVNEVGESVLATPAISEGAVIFRTEKSLISVGAR